MTKVQATAIGFIAIGLWALLALFTVGTNMVADGLGAYTARRES